MSRSAAVWLIVLLVFLWCTASNLQLGHKVTDLEIQNRALKQMVRECKP